jgi:hypothetical protein
MRLSCDCLMITKLGKQKCLLCGCDTNQRLALALNGKFPPNFSRHKINKIEHRAAQLNALINQIERPLNLEKKP